MSSPVTEDGARDPSPAGRQTKTNTPGAPQTHVLTPKHAFTQTGTDLKVIIKHQILLWRCRWRGARVRWGCKVRGEGGEAKVVGRDREAVLVMVSRVSVVTSGAELVTSLHSWLSHHYPGKKRGRGEGWRWEGEGAHTYIHRDTHTREGLRVGDRNGKEHTHW